MNNQEVKSFFKKIKSLRLNKQEKKRMMKFIQLRINRKINKVFSYEDLKVLFSNNKVNITHIMFGPRWNRLIFMDVEVKDYEQ